WCRCSSVQPEIIPYPIPTRFSEPLRLWGQITIQDNCAIGDRDIGRNCALTQPIERKKTMADQQTDPVFQIQRVYLKKASLEQPNSPGILLEQEQPAMDIQLAVEAVPT